MIEAYRDRRESAAWLARAAAVASDEGFKAVMQEAFPPRVVRLPDRGNVQRKWWGRDRG